MNEINSTGDLIHQRRKALGLTLQEVGDAVGVGKSTVKKWETGLIRSMKKDRIVKLANVLQLEVNDLLLDEAELPSNCTPVNVFRDSVQIPVIGRVAAGLSCHAEEDIEGYELAPKNIINSSDRYVYLRVQGDSMSPLILDGDLVLIRCQSSVDSGTYAVVIIDDDDGVVKKVRYGKDWIELISENPYYPPRRFEGEDVQRVRVFGRVMESKHKF